ncbi:hypothetical protein AB1046_10130 [Promicromonospora sp. Populi]|uniref:hypothetical protein n=1 Tax=Promicromonospora sp. Populi TaxID=3239420 RepID=UPI0034E1C849
MKRKFVSRALPSVLVAGGLIVAGSTSAMAAGENTTAKVEQSTGGLGDVLTGTVDAVVGKGGAVDSTLKQVTETVGQVTKEDGALDDTVKGVTGVVDSVAGKDGAVDDVVSGVTGSASAPAVEDAPETRANEGGPVEDVVSGLSGAVNAVAGEDGAVDDVLGADAPTRGLTDNLVGELIDDVGSVGENLGNGDVPGTIGTVTGEDGIVDDLLESPGSGGPGDPGNPGNPGDPGTPGPGDDGSGTIPVGNPGGGLEGGFGLIPGTGLVPITPIQAIGEATAPEALAQTGGQAGMVAIAALGLTAAGAAMVRMRRRMLEVQD